MEELMLKSIHMIKKEIICKQIQKTSTPFLLSTNTTITLIYNILTFQTNSQTAPTRFLHLLINLHWQHQKCSTIGRESADWFLEKH